MNLGFGPMSTEVIEAIYQYSHGFDKELMLIASKNQIDYDGGYVNRWDTEDYTNHLSTLKEKYPKSRVLVCRDHCGPGFKPKFTLPLLKKRWMCLEILKDFGLYDTIHTIETDIQCGFDLIHIDLCHYGDDIVRHTCDLIDRAKELNPNIQIEVGTDDIENGPTTSEKTLDIFRRFEDYNILYYVVNTGSLIKENKQVGNFDREHTLGIKQYLNLNQVKLKEHNADYLSTEQIQKRHGCVDAMNIAPQLGVVQTTTVLSEAQKYGISVDDFVNLVYNSRRWEKWDNGNLSGNPYLSTIVAGHYHFTSDEYLRIIDQFESPYRGGFIHSVIRSSIKGVISHYDC